MARWLPESGIRARLERISLRRTPCRTPFASSTITTSPSLTKPVRGQDDRVGAMAQLLSRLGTAGVNVIATSAGRTRPGRYGALLWVAPRDVRKAAETLGA